MDENKDILMRNRSAGSCIKYGYNLYFSNFKSLFKTSFLPALFYAAVCGILGVVMVVYAPQMLIATSEAQLSDVTTEMTTAIDTGFHAFLTVIVVLLIICGALFEILAYSRAFAFLHCHKTGEPFASGFLWRKGFIPMAIHTLKGITFTMLIVSIPVILIVIAYKYVLHGMIEEPSAHLMTLSLSVFVLLLIIAFLLPLAYPMMKYILEDKQRYLTLLKAEYKTGLSYLGLLFVVLLVNVLILIVAGYVIELPAVVISMANYSAYFGQLIGDPLGLPSYLMPMTALVFFFAGVIQIFLRMAVIFSLYYVYGTIEVREAARKNR